MNTKTFSHLALTTALVGVSLMGYGRKAYGACTNNGGSTYLCSGTETTTQTINTNNAAVSTADGFSVITTTGDAIDIDGEGALSFTDNYGSIITGNSDGIDIQSGVDDGSPAGSVTINVNGDITGDTAIRATNLGTGVPSIAATGEINVTTSGAINGVDGDGISADNIGGTDITINTAAVTGSLYGIDAYLAGTGALAITSTGTVISTADDGIRARNINGSSLSINSAGVTGGSDGINAYHGGSGALSITSTGDVSGNTGFGIYAINNGGGTEIISTGTVSAGIMGVYARSYGTDLTVTTNVVNATAHGINANNRGTGFTLINSNGTLTSDDVFGIQARNDGTNLEINAAAINSSNHGIYADNNGSGHTIINVSEDIISTNNSGIVSDNDGGTYTNIVTQGITADNTGIRSSHDGSGATTITVNGDINSGVLGIIASNGSAASDIEIIANAVSSGTNFAISADNDGTGSTTITANGVISSATGQGIFANNAASAQDLIINSIDIDTNASALNLSNGGSGQTIINNTGSITSSGALGINLTHAGSELEITTGGDITASSLGISVNSTGTGDIDITNGGTVTSENSNAVSLTHTAGNSSISTNNVQADVLGIAVTNTGAGSTTITNTGYVNSTTSLGIYATSTGTDLTISAGDITAARSAIFAGHNGTGALSVTTTGTVTVTGVLDSAGIQAANSANGTSLTINSAAVTGDSQGILATNEGTGALSITATGTVTGGELTGNAAIEATNSANGTSLTINTAAVTDGYHGIRATNEGTGALSVSATGAITNEGAFGVDLNNSGTNTTLNAVDVSSGYGVQVVHGGSGYSKINITGDIVSTGKDGVSADTAGTYSELTVNNVTAGIGAAAAVAVQHTGSGTASITATGDITSAGSGGSGRGIEVSATNGADITIDNASVTGATTGILASTSTTQIDLTLNGMTSAASVTGAGGTAIDFGAQDDTLMLQGTVGITGNVLGDSGTDVLTFDNSTVTLGAGNSFQDFETVNAIGNNTLNADVTATALTIGGADGGNLRINGALNVGTLTIGSGGDFGGTNTLTGDLVVGSGGSLSPGNSPGIINVTGNSTFNAGSAFNVEVEGTQADQLIATGNIAIDPGATLNIVPLSGFSGNVDILSAGGALTGTFDTVNTAGQLVAFSYSPTALNLTSLNPASASAQLTAGVGSGLLFSDTILDQTASGQADRGQYLWAQGVYRGSQIDAENGISSSRNNQYGIALGGQKPVADGISLGFSLADIAYDAKVGGNAGDSDGNGVFASVYGTFEQAIQGVDTFATIGALAGYRNHDSLRRVTNSGVNSNALSGANDTDIGALVQIGTELPASNGWQITPKVSATYLHTFAGSYSETGGGAGGVRVKSHDFGTLKTSQSLEISQAQGYAIDTIVVRPHFGFGLSQEISATDRNISGTFGSGGNFSGNLDERNRNFINANIGADLDITDTISGYVNYQYSKGSTEQRSDARVGVNMKF